MHKKYSGTALLTILFYQCAAFAHEDSALKQIEANLLPKVQVAGETYLPSTISQRMKHFKVPGLSVAVIKDGKIAWAKGYGIANKKTNQDVNINTLFQAGSISKPVAALAALKLVQNENIDLDTDANQYLNTWKIPDSSYTKKQAVTLRHLLTHTAGITVHGFPGYQQHEILPANPDVLNGKGNTAEIFVDQLPGSNWRYSGGGYTVMEQLVEDVSELSFATYLKNEILKPLGMSDSTFEQPLPKDKWSLASAAFDSKGKQIQGDWHNYPEQAAAGLWTTPTDLAKYIISIQKSRKGNKTELLNTETVNKMLTIHQGNWGLGPHLANHKQGLVFGHGGKNAGFTNNLLAYADSGNGIVIMSNGDSANPLIAELQIAISSFYQWDLATTNMLIPAKLSKDIATNIVGKYSFDNQPDYQITISINGGKINVYDPDIEKDIPFLVTGDNTISNLTSGSKINFNTNNEGNVIGLTWAGSYKFSKIED